MLYRCPLGQLFFIFISFSVLKVVNNWQLCDVGHPWSSSRRGPSTRTLPTGEHKVTVFSASDCRGQWWCSLMLACLHLPFNYTTLPVSIVSLCANLFETPQDARLLSVLLPHVPSMWKCRSVPTSSPSSSPRFCEFNQNGTFACGVVACLLLLVSGLQYPKVSGRSVFKKGSNMLNYQHLFDGRIAPSFSLESMDPAVVIPSAGTVLCLLCCCWPLILYYCRWCWYMCCNTADTCDSVSWAAFTLGLTTTGGAVRRTSVSGGGAIVAPQTQTSLSSMESVAMSHSQSAHPSVSFSFGFYWLDWLPSLLFLAELRNSCCRW